MESSLLNYAKVFVEFLGHVLGPNYEIVLHDLRKESSSMVVASNGHINDRKEGVLMSDLVLNMITDGAWKTQDYLYNHKGISKNNKNLISSTLFFKDSKNNLAAMLCINYDASRYMELSQQILSLGNLLPAQIEAEPENGVAPLVENADLVGESICALIKDVITDVLGSDLIPLDRLTQGEKLVIVERIYQKGVFSLKGAVSHVASAIYCSEASVYRYLSKINKSPVYK